MSVEREIIYPDRDNSIVRQVFENGKAPDATPDTVTRTGIILTRGDQTIEHYSDDSPSYLGLPDENWRITAKLGTSGIEKGLYRARLILFDANNTNGIVVKPFSVVVSS